ncbi:hypothetical protein PANDA_010539, partial [Ailuropoda melanoleuca]
LYFPKFANLRDEVLEEMVCTSDTLHTFVSRSPMSPGGFSMTHRGEGADSLLHVFPQLLTATVSAAVKLGQETAPCPLLIWPLEVTEVSLSEGPLPSLQISW